MFGGAKIKAEPLDAALECVTVEQPRSGPQMNYTTTSKDAGATQPSTAASSVWSGCHDDAPPPPSAGSVRTPKYSGGSDWESFHAQFELLADARRWGREDKALQLALCLEGDALSCLLLLDPAQRRCYDALVGALGRRFGRWSQPTLLKNELRGRCRQPGDPLRGLANDIEGQVQRAYGHLSVDARSELATDLFIGAISPPSLRVQVQLLHPKSLQDALEAAVERESLERTVCRGVQEGGDHLVRLISGRPADEEAPAWASEMTGLLRAMTLQDLPGSGPGPALVCWGCGKPGHIRRQCPNVGRRPGNAGGAASAGMCGPLSSPLPRPTSQREVPLSPDGGVRLYPPQK